MLKYRFYRTKWTSISRQNYAVYSFKMIAIKEMHVPAINVRKVEYLNSA